MDRRFLRPLLSALQALLVLLWLSGIEAHRHAPAAEGYDDCHAQALGHQHDHGHDHGPDAAHDDAGHDHDAEREPAAPDEPHLHVHIGAPPGPALGAPEPPTIVAAATLLTHLPRPAQPPLPTGVVDDIDTPPAERL